MFRVIVAVVVLGMAGAASAQSTAGAAPAQGTAEASPMPGVRKPCEELKGEIDAKIRKNGVEVFTLDIVDMDAQPDGKVVGTCDGQTKKIVYKRG
jgi:hypothetical protein